VKPNQQVSFSDTITKTPKLQSLFSLDKCYNTEEHSQNKKKKLNEKTMTFFPRISIKQKSNQTEFQFNPLLRIGFIRSSQVSAEQEFARLL